MAAPQHQSQREHHLAHQTAIVRGSGSLMYSQLTLSYQFRLDPGATASPSAGQIESQMVHAPGSTHFSTRFKHADFSASTEVPSNSQALS